MTIRSLLDSELSTIGDLKDTINALLVELGEGTTTIPTADMIPIGDSLHGKINIEWSTDEFNVLNVPSHMTIVGDTDSQGYAKFAGITELGSTLEVTGATTLLDTLDVSLATTLLSTLDVTGAATLLSTLNVTGNLTATSDATLGNSATLDTIALTGVTNITGATTIVGITDITGNTDITGTLGVTSNATVGGTLGVTGNLTATSDATLGNSATLDTITITGVTDITGATTIVGVTDITGNTDITGTLDVTSNTTVGGTLGVTGNLTATSDATLGNSATLDTIALTGVTNITGATTIVGITDITGNTDINGTLGVTSNTTVGGTLGVTGAATLNNTLLVQGATTINDTVDITGNTTVTGNLTSTGNATIGNSATLDTIALTGVTNITGATTIVGITDITGNTDITGTLDVTSNATVGGTLGVTGATTLNNTLNVTGATTLSSTLSTGSTTVNGNLTATGNATLGNHATADTIALTGVTDITGATTIVGNTDITGTIHATGAADFDSTLNVDGSGVIDGTLASGSLTVTGTANVTGATTVGGTLAAGSTTVTGNLTSTGNATLGNSATLDTIALTGVTNITGNTTLIGTLHTTGAVDFDSTLNVDGSATIDGTLAAGTTTITGAVSTTTTGAIGTNLTVGGFADITGTLDAGNTSIAGWINTTGSAGFGGTLSATGATVLSSTLAVTGATTLSSTLAAGNTTITGTLTSTGNTTLGNSATLDTIALTGVTNIVGNTDITGTLHATGAVDFDSNLNVDGTATIDLATTIGGTLGVTGATTLSSTLGVTGNTTIGGTLVTTGTTTNNGATVLNGATTLSGASTIMNDGYLKLHDNIDLRLGTGSDFRMDFNGSTTIFRSYAHGAQFLLQGENNAGINNNILVADPDAAITLYHAGVAVANTTTTGLSATTFTGNATSASKWATARTITLGGELTGSVSLDGTANVTISNATLAGPIASNMTFLQDVVVQGDLSVTGTTTSSNESVISDNIFTLNDGETGSTVTGVTSGLRIDRGTGTNAEFLFDDAQDEWTIGFQGGAKYEVWHAGNDGAGSGLDADKLDGINSTQFVRSDQADTMAGLLTIEHSGDEILKLVDNSATGNPWMGLYQTTTLRGFVQFHDTNGLLLQNNQSNRGIRITNTAAIDALKYNNAGTYHTIWHAGNDGAGSGLDADFLDGINSVAFVRDDGAVTDIAVNTVIVGDTAVDQGWDETYPSIQLGNLGSLVTTGIDLRVLGNAYYGAGWKRMATGNASAVATGTDGDITFFTATSAAENTAITWTELGRFDQTSGDLLITNDIDLTGGLKIGTTDIGLTANAGVGLSLTSNSSSTVSLTMKDLGGQTRGALYSNADGLIGLTDADGNWAIKHTTDSHTDFSDNNAIMFSVGVGGVTGNYGNVSTKGAGKGGYEGYSINGAAVFMSNGTYAGLFNDTNNEWMVRSTYNGNTELYANGISRLQATTSGVSVTGEVEGDSLSISGNATIIGDLTVQGTTTGVNTTDLDIEDNNITLNKGETGAGITAGTAGIIFDRGTTADALFQFDESIDKLTFSRDNGTTKYNILTTEDTGAGNGFDADTVDGIHAASFLRSDTTDTATGNLTFNGTAAFTNSVNITGASTGLGLGSKIAVSQTDLSKHIALYSNNYGFNITSGTMNIVAAGGTGNVDVRTTTLRHNGVEVALVTDKAPDSELLDGINSTSFLRSDTSDSFTGTALAMSGNAYTDYGPNSSYGQYLRIGGNGEASSTNRAGIAVTNGNLHIDAAEGTHPVYLNFYGGTGGTWFGSGNDTVVAVMGPDGDLWKGAADNTGSKYWHAGNDGAGSGLDADLLDGHQLSTASTASTVVERDTAGDINARLFRSEYDTTNASINFIMTQVDTATNNYIRPSTPAQFRSSVTDAHYLGISAKANDSDKLDGINSTQFLRSDTTVKTYEVIPTGDWGGPLYEARFSQSTSVGGPGSIGYWTVLGKRDTAGGYSGIYLPYSGASTAWIGSAAATGTSPTWHKLWSDGNDGVGSGLDADLLDGQHGSYYATAAHNHDSDYLGISAKAADSELLDGINSTQFIRSDAATTLTNADIIVGGSYRDHGMFGTYNPSLTQHIWSMGTAYRNNAAGTNFGNLYGLAYKHTNNTTGGTMASAHQVVWCQNGIGTAALGNNVWTSGNVIAEGAATITGAITGASLDVSGTITLGANNMRLQQNTTDELEFRSATTTATLQFANSADADLGYIHGNGNTFGLLDTDRQWAIKHTTDSHTDFYDNNELMFSVGVGGVTGDYGTVQVKGGGKGSWDGYSIEGAHVFMGSGTTCGLYNDTNNEWYLYATQNGAVDIRYNGSAKLTTTNTGVTVTGTVTATTFSGNATSATNADTVDGYHANSGVVGNTVPVRNGSGYLYSNYFNMTANDIGATTPTAVAVEVGNDNFVRWDTWASFRGKVLPTASEILTSIKTVDGAGSGLDADLLDGLSSASFVRADADETKTGYLIMSDSYLRMNDNLDLRLGTSNDFRMEHTGTDTIFRSYLHGSVWKLQCEETGGTNRNMIWADPDVGVSLYQGLGGTVRLQTNTTGVAVTGALTTTTTATIGTDLTVSGGDITLGGTGRIQGVDTVTADTDAANKSYVDAQIAASGLTGRAKITSLGNYNGHMARRSLVRSEDGTLWSWGVNDQGQLGTFGYTTAHISRDGPMSVRFPPGEEVISHSAAYHHSAAVTEGPAGERELYTWGYNNHGQLGTGNTTSYAKPQKITTSSWNGDPDKVFAISSYGTPSCTFVITTTGKLYATGYNANGGLGNGGTTNISTFTLISLTGSVTDVAGCAYTNYIVLAGVWQGSGYNAHGQLGRNNTTQATTFANVQDSTGAAISTVDKIEVTSSSNLTTAYCLTTANKLYTVGHNGDYQCGTGNTTAQTRAYNVANSVGDFQSTHGRYGSTMYVTTTGALYGFGRNWHGELGRGNTTQVTTPTALTKGGSAVTGVDAIYGTGGMSNTPNFWYWKDEDGHGGMLYGAGYNAWYSLGVGYTGAMINLFEEIHIPSKPTDMCGHYHWDGSNSINHSLALLADGRLYSCGHSAQGQLGYGYAQGDTGMFNQIGFPA